MIIANALNDKLCVPSAAHCTVWRHIGLSSICCAEAAHGNDRVWKAWKAMKPASNPSHTLWKSLQDSHGLDDCTYVFSRPSTRTIATAQVHNITHVLVHSPTHPLTRFLVGS